MAEIIWSEPALTELDAVAEFIARDKPDAAKKLVQRVLSRVEQLALFPLAGRIPHELKGTRYRQLVVPPLRIFYRLNDDRTKVFIVHLLRAERHLRREDFR
jgi:plasmid stabilization system protein ParE